MSRTIKVKQLLKKSYAYLPVITFTFLTGVATTGLAQAQPVQTKISSSLDAIKLGNVDLAINPLSRSSAVSSVSVSMSSASKSSLAKILPPIASSSSAMSDVATSALVVESSASAIAVSSADVSSAVASVTSSATSSVEALVSIAQEIPSTTSSINSPKVEPPAFAVSKFILDAEIKPNSSVRLTWSSDTAVGGFSEATPVLVVHGAMPGKTLCLTGAVHGDELNGIEMIRRVIFNIDPAKLSGTVIGVPVSNIMGFRRNSRYLPDRRDWNRYFPGNTHGSSASRLAHSFFSKIIMHCDSLVDLHTGSFHRTNLPQLRADLVDENVARLAQNFGVIAVLNGRGHPNSLRAAAVRAGIPAVTLEAGEPMAMQSEVVEEGVNAINTLLAKTGMYGKQKRWNRIAPVYYRSAWVRANQSGILFSKAMLGQRVKEDDVLGTVTDPITNARTTIKSPYTGRIIGIALDQVVLPGFAAYHIGIQTPEAILIEESQMNQDAPEEDEEDGDDSGMDSSDEIDEPETGVSKAQDRMAE
jgi:predicted deacylase